MALVNATEEEKTKTLGLVSGTQVSEHDFASSANLAKITKVPLAQTY